MARKKRKVPGLNASSTADISFILLIFFLVTTSMDTDSGLARRLPPPPEDEQQEAQIDVKERNLLNVKINAAGQLLCGGDYIDITQLCDRAKAFIKNENNDHNLPEKHAVNIPLLGVCWVTDKHVISIQTDRGTSYNVYFQVQNELVRAYNELRDELSKAKFGKVYAALNDEQQA
ncbi:MAG: biopolymer transporter ExbD, partial [Paraprevotella sp.]|nr:biopolymer transporter ExbD [Paraprevotella sp.]